MEEQTNITIDKLLESWSNYITEKVPEDYEWYDTSDTYALLGFVKMRRNKEHPHTIDLMAKDGSVYYSVYPKDCQTGGRIRDDQNFTCTSQFGAEQEVKDFFNTEPIKAVFSVEYVKADLKKLDEVK